MEVPNSTNGPIYSNYRKREDEREGEKDKERERQREKTYLGVL